MARRKRHHTVTLALLHGFSKRKQVVTRPRSKPEFTQSVTNATVVADFYSFDNKGAPDDAVEDWLTTVVEDGFTHELLPEMRDGRQPTAQEYPAIARFLAAAATRTRTARSYMDQIDHHTAGTTVLATIAPQLGWDLTEMSTREVARLRDHCQKAWLSLPPRTDHAASRLRTVVRQSRSIEGRLLKYAWSVAMSDEPSLLIGDAPVLALDGNPSGWRGLVPDGATVFMPLSPHAVLVGEPHVFSASASVTKLFATVNALTAREAFADVFRHPAMTWPAAVRLGSNPPLLPTPSISFSRRESNEQSTFPHTYPKMDDAETTAILQYLGANSTVE